MNQPQQMSRVEAEGIVKAKAKYVSRFDDWELVDLYLAMIKRLDRIAEIIERDIESDTVTNQELQEIYRLTQGNWK